MLEVAGGNRDKVGDTQKQYTSTGTVDAGPEKLRCQVTPGEGRSWPCETLTWIVSGLVGK